MGQYSEMITAAARRTRAFADKLIVGVKPEQAARKPRFESPGVAVVVDCNHPTWVFGHLSLYPNRMMTFCGLETTAVSPAAGWEDLFKAGTQCQDDPKGTIYPAWSEITAAYFKNTDLLLAAVPALDDKVLLREFPEPKYREFFPTIGTGLTFMMNNHVMMHFGQISTWRRCFGLPSAL
jgi:hypothetical protein